MTDFAAAVLMVALLVLMFTVSAYGLGCALTGCIKEAKRLWSLKKEANQ